MRVVCLQENLAKGLSTVSRAIATQTTLPVLANVLLRTDSAQLKLSATNLEIGINCWIGAKVEEHGAITVPARLLSGFVNSLPTGRVEMTASARTKTLHIRCAQHEANIKGIDAAEFPLMPDFSEERPVKLPPDVLRSMIEQVTPAAASDESRPVLTGVLTSLRGDELSMVASDGFRMSLRTTSLPTMAPEPQSVIIPAGALRELAHIAADEKDEVEMCLAQARNQVFFRGTKAEMLSQLVEGRFPDYERFIPRAHATQAAMDTSQLADAVRLSLFFARDSANIVKVHITPGENGAMGRVKIDATSAQMGDNVSEIEADVEGKEEEIAFNARYLLDVLSVIHSARMTLETTTPSSPAVIKPVGGEDFLHVIVPIMVY